MAKFLRMEKAETGQCFTLNYEKRCYFHDGIRKRMGKECEHCGNDIVYIEDTVIPQKMKITDMDDWEIITRTAFSEWLRGLETAAKARVYKAAVDQLAGSMAA